MPSRGLRSYAAYLFIFLFAALLAATSYFRSFDLYENATYDWRFRLKPKPPISDKIVIIAIGDDTLSALGSWPFNREYHGILIDVLKQYGARMVGFDVLFVETTPGDEKMRSSAWDFGRTYFARAFLAPEMTGGALRSSGIMAPLVPGLEDAAQGVGFVNMEVDFDGKRRRMPPVIVHDGKTHMHLSVLMAVDYLGIPREAVHYDGRGNLQLGSYATMPLDDEGYTLVHFGGGWMDSFTIIPFAEILRAYVQTERGEEPSFDLNALKDKACLVGFTATASVDVNPIPLEPIYPGIGTHASTFNMILHKQFITRLSRGRNLAILFVLALGAMYLARLPRLLLSTLSAAGVFTAYTALTILLFNVWHIWLDLFHPLVSFGVIYLAAIIRRTTNEKRRRELLEAELTIASRIQESFLPSELPQSELLDIAAFMRPAKQVGGDLYSIFWVDEEHIGVMLGDVSGKGTPAALFMAKSVSEFKFNSRANRDAAAVLTKMNESLSADESSGLFVTLNYAVFDLKNKVMVLSNGGHMPVLKIRSDGDKALLSPEGGMPLALMPGVEFMNMEGPIESGDVFLFYTDGISEARNSAGEDFEIARLTDSAVRHRAGTARQIQDGILKDVRHFVGHAPQHDDTTLVVVKIK